uniref:Uncharacterized protein n=1 Tax=Avena sativa TaxID=4498 RepID=A0ACD5UPE2_AVESA
MASQQVLLLAAAAIAVAFLLAPASADDFMVGDSAGWTLSYPATWTEGKTFVVGDSLTFMYTAGKHTVMEVTGPDFRACNVTGNQALGTWTSGQDTVPLSKAGRRWFVCSVGNHCAQGMKLLVVTADAAQAPAGPPSNSASFVGGAVSQAMAAAGAVAAAVLML